jgi:ABC-type phosphate transport system substrate-binding protein
MTMPRRILRLLTLALVLAGLATTSIASEQHFKIIVHPDNPSDSVSRDFLRDAFLKKETEWHGETLRPIDLSSKHALREHFTTEVIRKSPAQLRTYWAQQVFSGKGVPPPAVESPAAVVAYVVAHPGAVGYLPADADPGKAKVISIR